MKINWTAVWVMYALIQIGLGGYWLYGLTQRPSYHAEKVVVDSKLVEMHGGNVKKLEKEVSPRLMRKWTKNVDVASFAREVLPSAERSYRIDLVGKEWEAGAKGTLFRRPARYIPGNMWHWMRTDIPIYSCMKIWASGEIWRDGGTDPHAGPDGKNYFLNRLHENKRVVMPELLWGTLIGKVCDEDDAQGERCGAKMPLGSLAYRSPFQTYKGQPIGDGVLWVWTNQFGSETDLGDYSVGRGGFSFDAEPAPPAMCELSTRREPAAPAGTVTVSTQTTN